MNKPDLTTTEGVLDWALNHARRLMPHDDPATEHQYMVERDRATAAQIARAMRIAVAWDKWKAQFGADYLTEMGEYDGYELASDLTRAEKEPEK